ncbi:hypothetical protein Pmar_PMAR001136 [Perkinsus marinus ATCC 50983]|uniref:Uncharacterized protein n=1 Tax=Perkinsus marinus (strain ATCC 50983 / TXsc) TaxID=423536 RepID=C5KSY8_PERM5|nr:hypothetical protein Pmar_PMAR001136 [Perkinsus marinus ATCC 50983]EER12338.1 hypothetical protein Pmar_PMAR001136 [Perkinsus marinus ATCC 50983]|eukprot:XP_002780543.1 hypothetical protein Pmar_PMAR001136 [Perkinsus marinus ATCC 50983]
MSYFVQEPYQTEVVEEIPEVTEETTVIDEDRPTDLVQEETTVTDDYVQPKEAQVVEEVREVPETTDKAVVIDDVYEQEPEVIGDVQPVAGSDDDVVVDDETTIIQ